jgi:hypothetical protein
VQLAMSAKGQKRTWCSPDELFCYSWDTIKRPKNASPDANKPTAAPA